MAEQIYAGSAQRSALMPGGARSRALAPLFLSSPGSIAFICGHIVLALPLAAGIAFALSLSPAVLLIVESYFQNLLKTGIIPALKALL
jgi:hypothetical protein